MASGYDPDAPDWFEPEPGDESGPAKATLVTTPAATEYREESMIVNDDDLTADDDAVDGTATTAHAEPGTDVADPAPEMTDAAEPEFRGDTPGFTDWREELRERLKRIRERREREGTPLEVVGEEPPEAVADEAEDDEIEAASDDAGIGFRSRPQPVEFDETPAAAEPIDFDMAAPADAEDAVIDIDRDADDASTVLEDVSLESAPAELLIDLEVVDTAEDELEEAAEDEPGEAAEDEPEATDDDEAEEAVVNDEPEEAADSEAEASADTVEEEVAALEVLFDDEPAATLTDIEEETFATEGDAGEDAAETDSANEASAFDWGEAEPDEEGSDVAGSDEAGSDEEEQQEEEETAAEEVLIAPLPPAIMPDLPDTSGGDGPRLDFDASPAAEPVLAPEIDIAPAAASAAQVVEWDRQEDAPARPKSSSAAPLGERAAAGLCDVLVLTTIGAALVGAASSASGLPFRQILADEILWLGLTWSIFAVAYSVFFVGSCGQTIGRMVMRLRVVSSDQFAVGFDRAAIRLAAWVVSALPLGAGMLPALRDPENRALHDRLSKTRVVKA